MELIVEQQMLETMVENQMLLGDWRIVKDVGQGPLGRSVLAEHRFTKQKRLLKILPKALSDDSAFVERFGDEAALLSQLNHPAIAKIETASRENETYFLVSEYVADNEGRARSLADLLSERALTLDEIRAVADQTAQALDYAHAAVFDRGRSAGLACAHSALTPSAIMLSRSVEGSSLCAVKVIDFGLARVVGQSAWLTQVFASSVAQSTGSFCEGQNRTLQNFMFLSPEQRAGDWSTPCESDIWSFGVLIYWMLTQGRYPEGSWESNLIDLEAPAQLIQAIRLCLHPNPERRPKSVRDLLSTAPSAGKNSAEASSADIPNKNIKEYIPEKRDVRSIEPIVTDMAAIAGGCCFRGSAHGCRDELPRHEVRLNPFYIDIHPVTNDQFVRFLEFIGDEKDKHNHDIIRLRDSRIKKSSGKCIIERGYAKHPVVGVTWYGAQAYAHWVGKRLPTEAEWEVACCGGLDNPIYPTGEDIERSQANFFSSDTTPVMSYPPNGFGLFDFSGNVYEWCHDWYEYNYYDFSVMEPDNPRGPVQGVYRVLRGGCWKSLKEDLRCAKRHRNNPGSANGTYGFRCAADAEPR